MSKILTGSKIQLARGFSDGESKETSEKFMSFTTEREILLKRLNSAFKLMTQHRNCQSKSEIAKFNAAKSDYNQTKERLTTLNKKAKQQADLSQLMLNRLKQYIPENDWVTVVKLAKLDQREILEKISGWD